MDFNETPSKYANENVLKSPESSTDNAGMQAVRMGHEVYLRNGLSTANFLLNYFHEIGHIAGDELSFKKGEILTPDEVKYTIPKLDSSSLMITALALTTPSFDPNISYLKKTAEGIIIALTKNNFDINKVHLHTNVSKEELEDMIRKFGRTDGALTIGDNGNIIATSTRSGRNIELPALTFAKGGFQLLENAVNANNSLTGRPQIKLSITPRSKDDGSYAKAQQIVEKAYKSKGWVLPSLKDLEVISTQVNTI